MAGWGSCGGVALLVHRPPPLVLCGGGAGEGGCGPAESVIVFLIVKVGARL